MEQQDQSVVPPSSETLPHQHPPLIHGDAIKAAQLESTSNGLPETHTALPPPSSISPPCIVSSVSPQQFTLDNVTVPMNKQTLVEETMSHTATIPSSSNTNAATSFNPEEGTTATLQQDGMPKNFLSAFHVASSGGGGLQSSSTLQFPRQDLFTAMMETTQSSPSSLTSVPPMNTFINPAPQVQPQSSSFNTAVTNPQPFPNTNHTNEMGAGIQQTNLTTEQQQTSSFISSNSPHFVPMFAPTSDGATTASLQAPSSTDVKLIVSRCKYPMTNEMLQQVFPPSSPYVIVNTQSVPTPHADVQILQIKFESSEQANRAIQERSGRYIYPEANYMEILLEPPNTVPMPSLLPDPNSPSSVGEKRPGKASNQDPLPTPKRVEGSGAEFRWEAFEAFFDCLYPYQRELFYKAYDRNSIIYLQTGAGKTVVAAAIAGYHVAKTPNKKVVFLVNRVPLVAQQAAVLSRVQNLRIAEVCSERKLCSCWEDVRNFFDGIVMIDSIFYSWVLATGSRLFEDISVLILDEAHHAKKNAFYAKILKMANQEKESENMIVCGLSASPGAQVDQGKTRVAIEALMQTARAQMVMVSDFTKDLREKVTLPESHLLEYCYSTEEAYLDWLLKETISNIEDSVLNGLAAVDYDFVRAFTCADMPYGSPQYITRCREIAAVGVSKGIPPMEVLAKTLSVLNQCVLLLEEVSTEAMLQRLTDPEWRKWYLHVPTQCTRLELCFRRLIHPILSFLMVSLSKFSQVVDVSVMTQATKMKFLASLLDQLTANIEIDDFRGIVFCNTKKAAHDIVVRLRQSPLGEKLNPKWFVGHSKSLIDDGVNSKSLSMTDVQQRNCLDEFRRGITKVLIATSVAEEGLDVPTCNLVIRYEGVFSVQSFIQSRGRARKRDSKFIVIVKMQGASPFREVCKAINIQHSVVERICKEDQEAIIKNSAEQVKLFYEHDPMWHLQLFAKSMDARWRQEIDRVQGGTRVILILTVPIGTEVEEFRAMGIGNEMLAKKIAAQGICRQLHLRNLLANIQPEYFASGSAGVSETETKLRFHNPESTMNMEPGIATLQTQQQRNHPSQAQQPSGFQYVKEYDENDWSGPDKMFSNDPLMVLDRLLCRKRLRPFSLETVEEVLPDGQSGYRVRLMYEVRNPDGSSKWAEQVNCGPNPMVAVQNCALQALNSPEMGAPQIRANRSTNQTAAHAISGL